MKKQNLLVVLLFVVLYSCSEKETSTNILNKSINGVAQKGPFINGSMVHIYELNKSLNQTGKYYSTEIINNLGEFKTSGLDLSSSKIELTVDGYYFNEIQGRISESRLNLKSLSDLTEKSNVNVNILTHIIIDRIKALMKSGQDYKPAKIKAQNELLAIFKMNSNTITDFEDLDLSKQEEKNGILLAVSSIFQGKLNVGELSKLLADFKTDFGTDGKIDDANILIELINNAKTIDKIALRTNIEKLYKSVGLTIVVPDFEKHLTAFLNAYGSEIGLDISYPVKGNNGDNLLAMINGQEILKETVYSISAKFPTGANLSIRLKINVSSGNLTWTVDQSKQTVWVGTLKPGDEIVGNSIGGIADLPIKFSGTGTIGIQISISKMGVPEQYIGSKNISLTIK